MRECGTTGTRFCLVLPRASTLPHLGGLRPSAVPPQHHHHAALPRDVTGTHVLVIDDSDANRRFATFVATKLGCTVAAASDGDEAVGAVTSAAAAGKPYDVVLMDIVMVRPASARAARERGAREGHASC